MAHAVCGQHPLPYNMLELHFDVNLTDNIECCLLTAASRVPCATLALINHDEAFPELTAKAKTPVITKLLIAFSMCSVCCKMASQTEFVCDACIYQYFPQPFSAAINCETLLALTAVFIVVAVGSTSFLLADFMEASAL